jgi:TetR/AcrR family transcriptional repressor of nem operon
MVAGRNPKASGRARRIQTLTGSASKTARLVFAALQGALVVRRTTADASQMTDIISALKSQLASA